MRLAFALLFLVVFGLRAQPVRIVSTAPSITEILFALGLGDRVAGVTTYCRYPPEAARIAKIGTYVQPHLETILSLRPDLVIVQENPVRLRERLKALHLKVLEVPHQSVDDIFISIRRIGRVAGVPDRAERLIESIRAELDRIRSATAKLPRRKMMFVVGRSPGGLEGLMAVGRASYLNELIAVAGGVNVFQDAPAPYPKVSLEEVLARDPEVIVDMGEMAETVGVTQEQKQRVVRLWQRFPAIAAVRRGAVFAVASDIFVVPGPRMVDAARQFAGMLHPEAGL